MECTSNESARLEAIHEKIQIAATRCGRDSSAIGIMAVSKNYPFLLIKNYYDAGLRVFGESRVQEAESKSGDFRLYCPQGSLVSIGHIQTNKARKAVAVFDRIDSVDSFEIAILLAKEAARISKKLDILFELHTGEETKHGFKGVDAIIHTIDELLSKPESTVLRFRGLMTMAPLTDKESVIRKSFSICREAFDKILNMYSFDDFNILSMGMSSDFPIAIEEGATLIRIGTALFGEKS